MDIAKIRKKLRDTGSAAGSGQAAEPSTPGKEEAQVPPRAVRGETEQVKAEAIDVDAGLQIDLLTFILGREEFAFRIGEVLEIVKVQNITRVPNAGNFLLGVTSLRGKIIPVIDLKRRLSLEGNAGEDDKKRKIMILKGPKGPIGVLIDRIVGVIKPSLSDISETPPHLPEAEMKFIEGVALTKGRFISIVRTEEAVDI